MAELIFNADDYGWSARVNQAIERTVLAGRLTSLTVMANLPAASAAVALRGKLPRGVSVGMHLNLTAGQPLMAAEAVPSLITERGTFFAPAQFVRRLLTRRIAFEHLRREITAQIEAIQSLLGGFTHFDSHHHIHRFPLVLEALASAAAQTRAPKRIRTNTRLLVDGALRRSGTVRIWARHLRANPLAFLGLYFKARQRCLALKHGFSSPDYLLTPVPPIHSRPVDLATRQWARVFEALPQGRCEINFHPGAENGEENLLLSGGFERLMRNVRLVSYGSIE